jgi:hypothetical protein
MEYPKRDYETQQIKIPSADDFEISVSVTGVRNFIKWLRKKDKVKKKVQTEWIYDGCECFPEDGARSIPYCNEHWNPLIRQEVE